MSKKADVKIPKGWERVETGKCREGDKCWSRGLPGAPAGFYPADEYTLGKDAEALTCLIRRKAKPPVIPTYDSELVTSGKVRKGDLIWAFGDAWERAEDRGAVGLDHNANGMVVIRRKVWASGPVLKDGLYDEAPWFFELKYGSEYRGELRGRSRAEARRIRDAVLAALNGEG